MKLNLPNIFFRVKDNGASVYRVGTAKSSGRIEFSKLATVVLKSQKINTQNEVTLTPDELREINEWMRQQRSDRLAEDLRRISRDVNLATHQIASSSEIDDELEAAINTVLLSLFDLQREITEKIRTRNQA